MPKGVLHVGLHHSCVFYVPLWCVPAHMSFPGERLICVHTSNLKLATIGVLTPQRGANEKSHSAIHWLLFSREPALKAYHESQMIFILCENLGNWFLLKESMRDLKTVAPHYWRYPCTRHGSSLDSWTVIITGRDWNEPRVSILVPCLKPKKKGDVRVSNSVDRLRLLTFERRKKIYFQRYVSESEKSFGIVSWGKGQALLDYTPDLFEESLVWFSTLPSSKGNLEMSLWIFINSTHNNVLELYLRLNQCVIQRKIHCQWSVTMWLAQLRFWVKAFLVRP